MKPQNAYKEIRRLVLLLANSEDRMWDEARLRLLKLVTESPGIAWGVYQYHPDEYKAALQSCKLLFEPRIFEPGQEFFGWSMEEAKAIEEETTPPKE
jgi:hypothetical protein